MHVLSGTAHGQLCPSQLCTDGHVEVVVMAEGRTDFLTSVPIFHNPRELRSTIVLLLLWGTPRLTWGLVRHGNSNSPQSFPKEVGGLNQDHQGRLGPVEPLPLTRNIARPLPAPVCTWLSR